jgi:hypothetical protein
MVPEPLQSNAGTVTQINSRFLSVLYPLNIKFEATCSDTRQENLNKLRTNIFPEVNANFEF